MKALRVVFVLLIPILLIGDNRSKVYEEASRHDALLNRDGPFLLDTSAIYSVLPDTNWQDYPDIAFDGVNFLVVWQDDRNGDYDVYGARLSQEGVVIDTGAFPIVIASGDQLRPAVAFDGRNYLVVWEDHRSDQGDVYGARVDTSACVVDTMSFVISTAPNEQSYPSIVYGESIYLVGWRDLRSGEAALYAARVDTNGVVLDTSGVVVSNVGLAKRRSAIAFDGTNYLIVWEELYGSGIPNDVHGARVNQTGIVLDTNSIFVGSGLHGYYCEYPDVAFDGENYLVVYSEVWSDGNDMWTDVYAHRVDQNGVVLDIILVYELAAKMPCVAFDGDYYLIVWTRTGILFPNNEIGATRMAPSGQLLGNVTVSIGGNWRRSPAAVFGNSDYCTVWVDKRNNVSSDIYGSRINTGGNVLDTTGICVSTTAILQFYNQQHMPAVSSNGVDYLAVWEDEYSGNIHGMRIDSFGAPLDRTPISVSQHQYPEKVPRVAWNSSDYVVVWKRLSSLPIHGRVNATRVTDSGVVLDPAGVPISYYCYYLWGNIDITSDGVSCLVTHGVDEWVGQEWYGWIRGTLVHQPLTPVSAFVIGGLYVRVENPCCVFDGANYLLAYYHGSYGTHGIRGRRVSQGGGVGPEITISQGNHNFAAIAFGATYYLVVWQVDTYPADLQGIRVDQSGGCVGPAFVVCAASNSQEKPAVGFDGTHYWVVWQDNRNGEWDIYGARVDTAGNVLEEFPVSLQPGDQVAPAITRGPGDQLLITYSGWTGTINGQPANAMRIWGVFSTDVGVEESSLPVDVSHSRLRIVPNPFHDLADIRYRITDDCDGVRVKIYDIAGRLVGEFDDPSLVTGDLVSVVWDGTDYRGVTLPRGVYFVNLIAEDHSETEKVIFLK